jgi:antitoxin ParD1/3/4
MAKNTSIILGDFYDDNIKKELETGTYTTASEIIREGLRLVHERKLKITNINMALEIGEQNGKPLP